MAKRMIFLKLHVLFEILIRILFWGLFLWYDIADPFIRQIKPEELWKYQYPVSDSIIPAQELWLIITIFPALLFLIEYFVMNNREDVWNGILGLSLAYGLNGFITSLIKVVVGRPRPDFYYRCFPNGQGSDFTKCTGNQHMYLDGRKSFPSGHSSFSFTCMVFMTFYIGRKLRLFKDAANNQSWKLCTIITPLLVATLIAISRTCDYHHHYEDIIGGALLGGVLSSLCYRLYFPKTETVLTAES